MKESTFPKRSRLKNFPYKGSYAYFITICTCLRKDLFLLKDPFDLVHDCLENACKEEAFSLDAFCYMPDHLHFLVQGMTQQSNLKTFVKNFKQKSGYSFKRKFYKPLWQPSFYDHILRGEEDKQETVLYILNNPVRKGLVECYLDYPYLGSHTFDIHKLL